MTGEPPTDTDTGVRRLVTGGKLSIDTAGSGRGQNRSEATVCLLGRALRLDSSRFAPVLTTKFSSCV